MSVYDTCDEEVSRGGIVQFCEKTAVALRMDPEYPLSYPVCAFHARGEMVPLAEIMRADRTIRCDYCDAVLPSLSSRAAGLPTPDLIRRGLDPNRVVCPECAPIRTDGSES